MPSRMRCFKSFFKHTWQPQQTVIVPSPGSIWDYPYLDQVICIMDSVFETGPEAEHFFPPKNRIPESHMESPSRFKTSKPDMRAIGETELGEVKVQAVPTTSVATSTPIQPGNIPCKNGGCKSWGDRGVSERAESPWHLLKTIFLVTVIVALVLWVIVYTLLAQYQIL